MRQPLKLGTRSLKTWTVWLTHRCPTVRYLQRLTYLEAGRWSKHLSAVMFAESGIFLSWNTTPPAIKPATIQPRKPPPMSAMMPRRDHRRSKCWFVCNGVTNKAAKNDWEKNKAFDTDIKRCLPANRRLEPHLCLMPWPLKPTEHHRLRWKAACVMYRKADGLSWY